MTVKVQEIRETLSNNSGNSVTQSHSLVTDSTSASLDSVVQRLIDKKMGRRKQNCPQKTGISSEEGKKEILRGLC